MEKLFLLMPDLTGTRIDLDSQSNKKLTGAEIIAPVGIEKADLPGLVDDLATLDSETTANAEAIAAEAKDRDAADAAIIDAVGYNSKGDATSVKFNEYQAAIEEEIALNGGSEYAPVNEVNFQAWLDDQAAAARAALNSDNSAALKAETEAREEAIAALDKSLEEETARAIAAEGELDNKISDILSNTDLTELDSFTEVEAGVNSGFAELKTMILDVVQNSIERNFGAIAADGTQVLFAGYTTEYPKVFVNGILQEEGVDYTKASGIDGKGNPFSDITFTIAPVAGARVVVTGTESAGYASDRYEAPVIFNPPAES